jgi:hypothetical protein
MHPEPYVYFIRRLLCFLLVSSPSIINRIILVSLSSTGHEPFFSCCYLTNQISSLQSIPAKFSIMSERADALAGKAAERVSWSTVTSLAHLKLRVSEKFRKRKEKWDKDPRHHGTEEIHQRSHAWTMQGTPLLGRPHRSGLATGAPWFTSGG